LFLNGAWSNRLYSEGASADYQCWSFC